MTNPDYVTLSLSSRRVSGNRIAEAERHWRVSDSLWVCHGSTKNIAWHTVGSIVDWQLSTLTIRWVDRVSFVRGNQQHIRSSARVVTW